MGRWLTREELHEVVWTEPLYRAGPALGISVPRLVETCAQAHVPLPGRGHWGKVQFGKPVGRTPLPMRPPGVHGRIYVAPRRRDTSSADMQTFFGTMPEPTFPDDLVELEAAIAASTPRLRTPALASRTHRAIAEVLAEDDRRRREPGYAYARRDPRFDGTGDRRLRILNAVFIGLERMGAEASARVDYQGGLQFGATVGNTHVPFVVTSGSDKKRHREPGKPLEFRITSDDVQEPLRMWCDSESLPLERQISEIVAGVMFAGELLLRARERDLYAHAIEWRQRQDEERRRRQLEAERQVREREAAEERARVDRLLGEAEHFRQAVAIREYVQSARVAVAATSDSASAAFESWAASALAIADGIDPVRSGAFLRG